MHGGSVGGLQGRRTVCVTFCYCLCIIKLPHTRTNSVRWSSVWSRGMIPPLGGGGREFESRNGPDLFCCSVPLLLVLATHVLVLVAGNITSGVCCSYPVRSRHFAATLETSSRVCKGQPREGDRPRRLPASAGPPWHNMLVRLVDLILLILHVILQPSPAGSFRRPQGRAFLKDAGISGTPCQRGASMDHSLLGEDQPKPGGGRPRPACPWPSSPSRPRPCRPCS